MGKPKTDSEVRQLWYELARGKSLEQAALASEMSQPTARKFHRSGMMPSEMKNPRDYRTRENPFEDVWPEIVSMLDDAPRLKATTIFQELQEKYPGVFQDGQLRSLQRQMRQWRGSEGPNREIFFPQEHHPGDLGASDFTHMTSLGITIAGPGVSTHALSFRVDLLELGSRSRDGRCDSMAATRQSSIM